MGYHNIPHIHISDGGLDEIEDQSGQWIAFRPHHRRRKLHPGLYLYVRRPSGVQPVVQPDKDRIPG